MKIAAFFIALAIIAALAVWSIHHRHLKNPPSGTVAIQPTRVAPTPALPVDYSSTVQLAVTTTVPVPEGSTDGSNKSFAPAGSDLARLANTNPDKSYSPPDSNFARIENMNGLQNWNGAPKVPATSNWSGNVNMPATGNWSATPTTSPAASSAGNSSVTPGGN